MMSECFLQNVTGWSRKEAVLQCCVIFKCILRLSSAAWAQRLYLTGSITWAACTSWPLTAPSKCVGQTGNSWCCPHYFHSSWGFSCPPRILSCCFYPPSPFFCRRVYISFEEATGAHKLDWLLPATVSPPFFCIHLLLTYLSVATHENSTAN